MCSTVLWSNLDTSMKLPEFLTNPDPEIYFSDNFVVIDFETTNKDKGSALNKDNKLLLTVCQHGLVEKKQVVWGNEFAIAHVVEACEQADFIIAHNAKFELQWLVRAGLDLTKVVVFDTMIAAYVLSGNRQLPIGLDDTLARHGLAGKNSYVSTLIKGGVCPSEICPRMLEKYCIQDVKGTYELFEQQLDLLQYNGLLKVLYSRCLFTPVLADLERNGMHADTEQVTPAYVENINELLDINAKLDKMTGGINPQSPKQVAQFLYDVLKFDEVKKRGRPLRGKATAANPEGARKASADVIAALKPTNKKQREFLVLKKVQSKINAAITKTLKPLYNCVNETEDQILFANFNQCITQTHRLSSNGKEYSVQFQNFPRRFKKLFNSRFPGWSIIETDSGQLEFRVAVYLAQDEQGFTDIQNGVDVHAFTASIIFKEEYEECGGDMKSELGKKIRQDSKPHTFKPLYGGQMGTEREMEYYAAFRKKYVQITAMQEKWKHDVLANKELTTITGLKFYWPDTTISARGYIKNSTSICNYPVQMFATADIMPIAVTFLWHYLKAYKLKSFLVNTIHDSAIGEVHPDEIKKYSELGELSFNKDVVSYMEKLYNIEFNMPLECEIDSNDHWGTSLAA